MDGNFTNDTDASNKMWLMKYPKAGTYIITLNVWDRPESADRAYNSTRIKINMCEQPPKWPPEIIDPPADLVKNPDGKDVTGDVVIRTIRGTDPPVIALSANSEKSYDIINIISISAENDDNMLIMTLVTKGNIFQDAVKNENAFYSFYIVGKGYMEPTIDSTMLASIEIDFFYNFTYREGVITVTEPGGETVDLGYINRTIEGNGTTLVMRVPMHRLSVLIDMVKEEGETDIFDIFAVAVYTSSKTEAAETVRIFARDSMGNGVPGGTKASGYPKVWFPKDETPPPNGNGDPDGNGDEQMLYLILGISGAVVIVVIILGASLLSYTRIKRKKIMENETRQMIYAYVLRNPGAHYSRIRRELNISGNTLTHHIRKLREAELIRVKTEGNFKFIYPYWTNDLGCQTTPGQQEIIALLIKMNGATVKELAGVLGKKPRTIRYHMGNLADRGAVRCVTESGTAEWFAENVQGHDTAAAA